MSDTILTALMPASITVAAVALASGGLGTALYASGFYWLWACKNLAVGPLKRDAGLITFALYAASVLQGWPARRCAGCAFLLAANYGVPCAMMLMASPRSIAKKLRKTEPWASAFRLYLGAGTLYWLCVGAMHLRAGTA
mmetsp:Transcript_11267/g.28478  ORF Transcript_11267/g.28478 Transcript_11267/m.28478 type:complete len:139 (-) Transcript_11267:364-780(-)